MSRDRRRIEKLSVDVGKVTENLQTAREKLPITHSENRDEALMAIYESKGVTDALDNLMEDIIIENISDAQTLPTHKGTKIAILRTFKDLTGRSHSAALERYTRICKRLPKLTDMAMITHHAAAVGQDVVGKMYADLNKLNAQEDRLMREIEDLDPNVEKDAKVIFAKESRLNSILGKKKNLYEQLLVYSKMFGADLAIKTEQNEINRQKVEVLANKFDNDATWQAGDLAIRHSDLSHEERQKLFKQIVTSNRGLSEMIEAEYRVEEIYDDVTTRE
jgi:hypothetical protein